MLLNSWKKKSINYDYILLLQTTCLKKIKDIDFTINFLLKIKEI